MYSNILVPVVFDADKQTGTSLAVARELRAEGGVVTLLHVMEDLPEYATQYIPKDYLEQNRAEIASKLKAMAQDVPQGKAEVISGHSGQTILEYAKKHDNDLIVVASHRPGVADYFLGGTAARVVRHAPCAVHVVR